MADVIKYGRIAVRPVKQICSKCGREFLVFYKARFNCLGKVSKIWYEYDDTTACYCEADFYPADGEPSIGEWAAEIEKYGKGEKQ